MNKDYIEVAKITKPQGLKGHLRAQLRCDSPEVLVEFADCLHIGDEGSSKTPPKPIDVTLTSIRSGFVVVKIEGIDDIGNAEVFVNQCLFVPREEWELPDDTWFIADLIGLKVIDADNPEIVYGHVTNILQDAPKDVYVIDTKFGTQGSRALPDDAQHANGERSPRELLFPAIKEVLISTDTDAGVIKIRPLEGLFDL
ncbi:MAG: ribosome maturation factor RimM [Oscillospiraceae bacterium]|nr:ribosome maturation factor RimM [Oscillospiraceae bacterium]